MDLTPALLLEITLLVAFGIGCIASIHCTCRRAAAREDEFRARNNIPHRPHTAPTKAHAKETR